MSGCGPSQLGGCEQVPPETGPMPPEAFLGVGIIFACLAAGILAWLFFLKTYLKEIKTERKNYSKSGMYIYDDRNNLIGLYPFFRLHAYGYRYASASKFKFKPIKIDWLLPYFFWLMIMAIIPASGMLFYKIGVMYATMIMLFAALTFVIGLLMLGISIAKYY